MDLVPGIINLRLESFSVVRAALFVGDAQRCLKRLLGLVLGIGEGFLPLPNVVLKRREEIHLTLELLRSELIGAVPGFALLSLPLLLLTGLLLGGGLCLCGFYFSHRVICWGVFSDNQINL